MTASVKAHLPQELYGYQVINLSQIPPTKLIEERKLISLLQTAGDSLSERLLYLLPIIIEVLTPSLLTQYAECSADLQKTLFTLCVFHAQVLCEGLFQPPLSSLVFVLSHLHQLHPTSMNIIIDSIRSLVRESYFTVWAVEEDQSAKILEPLLTILQNGSGVLHVTDSLPIPLPSPDVSPLMYCQYLLSVASQLLKDSSWQRYSVLLILSFKCVRHLRKSVCWLLFSFHFSLSTLFLLFFGLLLFRTVSWQSYSCEPLSQASYHLASILPHCLTKQ